MPTLSSELLQMGWEKEEFNQSDDINKYNRLFNSILASFIRSIILQVSRLQLARVSDGDYVSNTF